MKLFKGFPDTDSDTDTGTDTGADCDAGGKLLGGACWYYGEKGDNCTETCADHNGDNSATRTYAGYPEGTKEHCQQVLDELGAPGTTVYNDAGWCDRQGCFYDEWDQIRIRCNRSATTADSYDSEIHRACACNRPCTSDGECGAGKWCDAGGPAPRATRTAIANHPYDFEGCANDGWTLQSGAEWEYGTYSLSGYPPPYQGSCVIATDLDNTYSNNASANNAAISPAINLAGCSGRTVYLKWSMWYEIENGYDKLYVDVSSNGGSSWTNGVASFTNNNNTWNEYSVNVSPYLSSTFKMRFRFTSNSAIAKKGPYIDYVRLTQ